MTQEAGITVATRLTSWLSRKTAMNAIRRVADLPIAMATDVGAVRRGNEDRIAVARGRYSRGGSYIIAAVCDGMGGMADGAVCASLGLGTFFSEFFALANSGQSAEDVLVASAMQANNAVFSRYRGAGGTTLSAVLIEPDKSVYWLNVGDSRVYHYGDSVLTQLTKDDTIAGQLAGRDPAFEGSSDLLQYIGIGPDIEPHVARFLTLPDTRLLLTSDGVHYLQADLMEKLASHAPDHALYIRRLIELSKWCGGHDNASAVIVLPNEYDGLNGSSDDPFLYEVWDAFGELQLVVQTPPPITLNVPKEPIDGAADSSMPEQGSDRERGESAPNPPEKTKKSSKRKKSGKMDGNREGEAGGVKAAIPQLKIEFPNKS
jgi:serine/threonine protein phosphatase PrpC